MTRLNVLLCAALSLALTAQQAFCQPAQSAAPQALYESALSRLGQGYPWQASLLLNEALAKYSSMGDRSGVLRTRIAQSELHHSLGQNLKACKTMIAALNFSVVEICSTGLSGNKTHADAFNADLLALTSERLHTRALTNLGFYLSALGNLEASGRAIQRAEEMLESPQDDSDSELLLVFAKANLEKFFFLRNQNRAARDDSPLQQKQLQRESAQYAQVALSLYERLARTSDPSISLKARLSWVELYSAIGTWSRSVSQSSPLLSLQRRKRETYTSISSSLSHSSFDDLPRSEAIYGRIRWAELQLENHSSPVALQSIYALAKDSLQDSRELENIRGQSFALGLLGQIYERSDQPSEAQSFFRSAINQAQSINAWDSVYRWQWMMAKSLAADGQRDEALAHYRMSVQSLEHVRNDLLAVDSELQFSFASEVAPVYREYMHLLLDSVEVNSVEPALEVYSQLQTAELENYLRCGRLSNISIASIKDAPSTVYILDLGDRYEVILRKKDGTYVRHQPEAQVVRASVTDLQNYQDTIQTSRFDSNVNASLYLNTRILYEQLFEPLEEHLSEGSTVNFVLDSSLQGVPIALLNRGQDFLIDAYAPATILQDHLLPPRQLDADSLKVLIAGISSKSPSMKSSADPSLKPLPEVQVEVTQIASIANKSVSLLDEQFTLEKLDQSLGSYPVVHIASHGQFSSNPKQNFIYAWDSTLGGQYFQSALERQDLSQNSIELLVLSACQTAKGDPQSSLGLAGLSVRAGARSTVASLWKVDSGATTLLMNLFYDGLREGLSKAEALQQAQQGIKRLPRYSHPYYWAGFILVGSWL
ncbi:CHAT domain-containing protein [Acaryochloris thomasi]|nr:CHAT domain-containing protein [Acaryochloris thomasi]